MSNLRIINIMPAPKGMEASLIPRDGGAVKWRSVDFLAAVECWDDGEEDKTYSVQVGFMDAEGLSVLDNLGMLPSWAKDVRGIRVVRA